MLQKLHISIIARAGDFRKSLEEVKNIVINGNNRGFSQTLNESYSFRVEPVQGNEVFVEDTWKRNWQD